MATVKDSTMRVVVSPGWGGPVVEMAVTYTVRPPLVPHGAGEHPEVLGAVVGVVEPPMDAVHWMGLVPVSQAPAMP